MKTRKWSSLLLSTAIVVSFFCSCHEWGESDPPSGNQVYPKLQVVSNYAFESFEEMNIELLPDGEGKLPKIVMDPKHGNVLEIDGGYARFVKPYSNVKLQLGGSFTLWVKPSQSNEKGALFSLTNEDNSSNLSFAGNGAVNFKSPNGSFTSSTENNSVVSNLLTADEWHYIAIIFNSGGYSIYVDGQSAVNYESTEFDFTQIRDFMMEASYLNLGYGNETQLSKTLLDDFKVYRNIITVKEINVPVVKPPIVDLVPVYTLTFDAPHTTQIVGAGSIATVSDPGFGKVFKNAAGGTRQNYLLLPGNLFSYSAQSREISIGMWVNATNAGASSTYMWSPLFTAYGSAPNNGANGAPMFALQYRAVMMINNSSGWCDFWDAQNTNGANTVLQNEKDWLADHKWHYYVVTMTENTAKVYIDAKLINEWEVDNTSDGQIINGLFDQAAAYTYICLGGNQAWSWGDPDPGFMFDDFVIYNKELSESAIKSIIASKPKNTVPTE